MGVMTGTCLFHSAQSLTDIIVPILVSRIALDLQETVFGGGRDVVTSGPSSLAFAWLDQREPEALGDEGLANFLNES